MNYENLEKIVGIIQNITRGESCCSMILSLQTDNGIVNFVLRADTVVIDNLRLRRGMRIAAFYDASLPAPAIFPPRYQAELIAVLRQNQEVMLNYFNQNLTAEDNSLQLNLSPLTNVSTLNGQRYLCSPTNTVLLVFYTVTTFSIPPQTSPQRVIVMCPFE